MRDATPAHHLGAALLMAALAVGGLGVASEASAQQDAGQDSAASLADEAGPVQVDPRTGRRYREVRPREGLRRGRFSSPAWVVGGLGALTAGGAIAALVWRSRRKK